MFKLFSAIISELQVDMEVADQEHDDHQVVESENVGRFIKRLKRKTIGWGDISRGRSGN